MDELVKHSYISILRYADASVTPIRDSHLSFTKE